MIQLDRISEHIYSSEVRSVIRNLAIMPNFPQYILVLVSIVSYTLDTTVCMNEQITSWLMINKAH